MRERILLTVSESKRLIAKGVVATPSVCRAREGGIIAIAAGTTNAYVVQELLGERVELLAYSRGITWPRGRRSPRLDQVEKKPDLVLKQGKLWEGVTLDEAVREMGPGDVFIKGANALNYQAGLAGVLISRGGGGTLGRNLARVLTNRVTLLVPVGLEKEIATDLLEAAGEMRHPEVSGHILYPMTDAEIITEIEALQLLTGVRAIQVAAGGVGGAEGSVGLLLEGDEQTVAKAIELLESIWSEPPFVEG